MILLLFGANVNEEQAVLWANTVEERYKNMGMVRLRECSMIVEGD